MKRPYYLLILSSILIMTIVFLWREDHLSRSHGRKADDFDSNAEMLSSFNKPTFDNKPERTFNTRIARKADLSPAILHELILQYKTANNYDSKLIIVNKAISSVPSLLESCVWRVRSVGYGTEMLALGHFASAYISNSPKGKEELNSLLRSDDFFLLQGLLDLLCEMEDAGSNGRRFGKPLLASELPSRVSQVLRNHPELGYSVQKVLGSYGEYAKNESGTLLRVILSDDEKLSFAARLSLLQVNEVVYSRFDLGRDGPLSNEQRTAIHEYLEGESYLPAVQIGGDTALLPRTLYADIVRYQTARSVVEKCDIANSVAFSQPNVWESCSWRFSFASGSQEEILAHFVSVYFNRVPGAEKELLELLRSHDSELVANLLGLLGETCEVDEHGKMRRGKPLGEARIVPYIAQVAKDDSSLELLVASTLGKYGSLAKDEVPFLLRLLLKNEGLFEYSVRAALLKVDPDGVCLRFGIEQEIPVSEKQRIEIDKYLKLLNKPEYYSAALSATNWLRFIHLRVARLGI